MASNGNINAGKPEIIKVGPCGGKGGRLNAMNPDEVKRIVKISVRAGLRYIDGFTVQYERKVDGQEVTASFGAQTGGTLSEIPLESSEYIKNISGTVSGDSVASLTFATNRNNYGPFGRVTGNPFQLVTIDGDSLRGDIIGFHAYTDTSLNAIGVFVKATPENDNSDVNPTILTLGPCGGNGGRDAKMDNPKGIRRIVKIGVSTGSSIIRALRVSYEDGSGNNNTVTLGTTSDPFSEVTLDTSEIITKVTGTLGGIGSYLTSLTIETNQRTLPTYGVKNGTEFELPAINGGSINSQIIGFHARTSTNTLTGLGVYVKVTKVAAIKPVLLKLGPCGSIVGNPPEKEMKPAGDTRISKVLVKYADDRVFAISVWYQQNGQEEVFKLGVFTETPEAEINLESSDYITSIEGEIGTVPGNGSRPEEIVITSLAMKTNGGDRYGPYGNPRASGSVPFELHAPDTETIKGEVVGFHGLQGGALDAIGVYIKVGSKTSAV